MQTEMSDSNRDFSNAPFYFKMNIVVSVSKNSDFSNSVEIDFNKYGERLYLYQRPSVSSISSWGSSQNYIDLSSDDYGGYPVSKEFGKTITLDCEEDCFLAFRYKRLSGGSTVKNIFAYNAEIEPEGTNNVYLSNNFPLLKIEIDNGYDVVRFEDAYDLLCYVGSLSPVEHDGIETNIHIYVQDSDHPIFDNTQIPGNLCLPAIYRPFYMHGMVIKNEISCDIRSKLCVYNGVGLKQNDGTFDVGNVQVNYFDKVYLNKKIIRNKPLIFCENNDESVYSFKTDTTQYGNNFKSSLVSIDFVDTVPNGVDLSVVKRNMISYNNEFVFYGINGNGRLNTQSGEYTVTLTEVNGNNTTGNRYFFVNDRFYQDIIGDPVQQNTKINTEEYYEVFPNDLKTGQHRDIVNLLTGLFSLYCGQRLNSIWNSDGNICNYMSYGGSMRYWGEVDINKILNSPGSIQINLPNSSFKKWYLIGINDNLTMLNNTDFLEEYSNGTLLKPHKNFISLINIYNI